MREQILQKCEVMKFKPTPAEEVECELRTEIRINEGKIKIAEGVERNKEKTNFFRTKKGIYQKLLVYMEQLNEA